MAEPLMVNTPEWQAFMEEHIRAQPTPIGRATMAWVRDRFVAGAKVVDGSEMEHFQDGWLAREEEIATLRAEAETLREALEGQWAAHHKRRCAPMCSGIPSFYIRCNWPKPLALRTAAQPATEPTHSGAGGEGQ